MMSEPTISFKGNKRFRVDRGNSHYNSKKAKKETIIPALSVYKQETIYPDTERLHQYIEDKLQRICCG